MSSLEGHKIVLTASTSWYLYNFRKGTILALKKRGAQVICIAPKDHASERLVGELEVEYIHWKLDHNSANPFRELWSFLQIFILMLRLRPDIVFNFTAKANIYTGIACWMVRVAYANNIAGLGMEISSGSMLARIMRTLYGISNRGAVRVFTQNPDDLASLRRNGMLGKTPVTELAGSGVDLDRFTAQEVAPLPLTFVMIARLQADKGVRDFVAAAHRVRNRHPQVRFILVGPTEHTNRSAIPQAELSEWKAEGVVEIPGPVDDVRPCLQASHALVLPSHGGEGTPRIVLEAAASARLAIVSDVPGCRDAVIHGHTGLIHAVQDINALAGAMEQVASMQPEKLAEMSRAARMLAEERFSETTVIQAYLDCLNSVINVCMEEL